MDDEPQLPTVDDLERFRSRLATVHNMLECAVYEPHMNPLQVIAWECDIRRHRNTDPNLWRLFVFSFRD